MVSKPSPFFLSYIFDEHLLGDLPGSWTIGSASQLILKPQGADHAVQRIDVDAK